MIVLLSHPYDVHADLVCAGLRRKKAEFYRLHTEQFPTEVKITLTSGGEPSADKGVLGPEGALSLSSVESVWYRRPRAPVLPGPEDAEGTLRRDCTSALSSLYMSLRDRFWVNPPWNERAIAEDKLFQLETARQCGLRIPATLITNDRAEALAFFHEHQHHGSVIYKPYALHGSIFENGFIFTSEVSERHFDEARRFQSAPVFLQEGIPKKTELRITVIGHKVFASEILSREVPESHVDWRRGVPKGLRERPTALPDAVEQACLRLVKALGLVFGAIDMILTPDDDYVFLEINPAGQWLWVERKTELPLLDSFCEMLIQGRPDFELNSSGRPSVSYKEVEPEVDIEALNPFAIRKPS